MDKLLETLDKSISNGLPIFEFLERDDLNDLYNYLTIVNVYGGETICQEGNICDYLAFIASGKVEIRKNTEFEGKEVVVGILGSGSMVGEMWVLGNHPGPVTAIAKEDSTLVMLSRRDFNIIVNQFPKTGVKLLKGMLLTSTDRLKNAYERLASLF